MENKEIIYLAITIDVDPDNFDESIFGSPPKISYQGIEKGLPMFLEKARVVQDHKGNHLKITWYVRADTQLKEVHGEHNYLFKHYAHLWESFRALGDEIAWHPHVRTLNELKESYLSLMDRVGGEKFCSVRIGEAFHSNELMAQLDSWGILSDSTALPKRVRNDQNRCFNWLETPAMPYYPSKEDYRIPGDQCYKILEIPMTMVATQATYDREVVLRYLNLSFYHNIIKNSLKEIIRQSNFLVAILHPSELLSQSKPHALLSFDSGMVFQNIEYILQETQRCGKCVQFITIKEAVRLTKEGKLSYVAAT